MCAAFVGGVKLLPVRAGEITCRLLGCAVEAFDDDGHVPTRRAGRARRHRADAVDAGRLLGRSGRHEAARRLLLRLPGSVAPRRLDHPHRRRCVCDLRSFRRHAEPWWGPPRHQRLLRGRGVVPGGHRCARGPSRGRRRRRPGPSRPVRVARAGGGSRRRPHHPHPRSTPHPIVAETSSRHDRSRALRASYPLGQEAGGAGEADPHGGPGRRRGQSQPSSIRGRSPGSNAGPRPTNSDRTPDITHGPPFFGEHEPIGEGTTDS